jgi:hypothetical protein
MIFLIGIAVFTRLLQKCMPSGLVIEIQDNYIAPMIFVTLNTGLKK